MVMWGERKLLALPTKAKGDFYRKDIWAEAWSTQGQKEVPGRENGICKGREAKERVE